MGAALLLAGTAISAYGMYQQGQGAKKIGQYQQRVSEMAAESAMEAGERKAQRHGLRIRALGGRQATMYGATGFMPGTGTKEKLLDLTYRVGREEMADVRLNAARQAWGLRSRGEAAAISGRLAAKAANWQAAGTFISGIGSATSMAHEAGGWWKWPTAATTTGARAAATSVSWMPSLLGPVPTIRF